MSLSDNIVAFWKLGEASGTRNDSVGSSHLTDNNTVGQTAGKIGNCANFVSANSEFLYVNDNTDLSMGDIDFTVAFWFKTSTSTGGATMALVSKWNAGNHEYEILLDTQNRVAFSVRDGSGSEGTVTHIGAMNDGSWHLVRASHDSVNNQLNLKVDNGTADTTSWSTGVRDSNATFEIGRRDWSAHYTGQIDAVGVWKKVFSSQDDTDLWNNGNGTEYPFSTTQTISPSAITSAEAFGTATVTASYTITASSIASAESFGTATVTPGAVTVSPSAIASAEAFGSAVVTPGAVTISPGGIASAESFGTATVTLIPVTPATTPAERTLAIAAEARLLVIAAEDRSLEVTAETRTLTT